MHTSSSLRTFLLNRFKRIGIVSVGLFVFAFGYYLQLLVSIGVSPWHALNQGLSNTFGITFGQASISVSMIIVVADLLMREPIGLGTILDSFIEGFWIDFFLWLNLVPYQDEILGSLLMLFFGMSVMCLGQVIYMKAGLSCGPRDAMAVAIGKRMRRIPFGMVNIIISITVLFIGFLLGGSVGLGTLISILSIGIVMQTIFKICRFEPRDVEQEGLRETIQAFSTALQTDRLR